MLLSPITFLKVSQGQSSAISNSPSIQSVNNSKSRLSELLTWSMRTESSQFSFPKTSSTLWLKFTIWDPEKFYNQWKTFCHFPPCGSDLSAFVFEHVRTYWNEKDRSSPALCVTEISLHKNYLSCLWLPICI